MRAAFTGWLRMGSSEGSEVCACSKRIAGDGKVTGALFLT